MIKDCFAAWSRHIINAPGEGMFPVAEAAYKEILTLPLWLGVTKDDIRIVARIIRKTGEIL